MQDCFQIRKEAGPDGDIDRRSFQIRKKAGPDRDIDRRSRTDEIPGGGPAKIIDVCKGVITS